MDYRSTYRQIGRGLALILPIWLWTAASAGTDTDGPPRVYWKDGAFPVRVRTHDAGDGRVVKVTLYARRQGEKRWIEQGVTGESDTLEFNPEADGPWEMMTRGTDGAGWIEERNEPQLVVVFDRTPPEATLQRVDGGEPIRPGRVVTLKWTISDNNLDTTSPFIAWRPLEAAPDDPWNPVHRPRQARGSTDWPIPGDVEGTVRVRLLAADKAGNPVEEAIEFDVAPAVATRMETAVEPAGPGGTEAPRDDMSAGGLVEVTQERARTGTIPPEVLKRRRELARRLHVEALTLDGRGDAARAERCLRQAIRLDPSNEDVVIDYADFLDRLGRTRQAVEVLEAARADGGAGERLLFRLAEMYRITHRPALAETVYELLVERSEPSSPIVHAAYVRLIDGAVRRERPDEARSWIEAYLRRCTVPAERRGRLDRLKTWCDESIRRGKMR